ncbi:hypothetical protein CMK11_22210 [Candidatus Poribacteria bacterium]|nr:hypothetical protein [Candidatus Poribacteria bacterium]
MLERTIRELSPELQQEVEAFVKRLAERRAGAKPRYLRQDWAGALAHLRDEYTSLELQKRAREWRDA